MEGKVLNTTKADSAIPEMLVVSSSPHIRSNETVSRIMLDVVIAFSTSNDRICIFLWTECIEININFSCFSSRFRSFNSKIV